MNQKDLERLAELNATIGSFFSDLTRILTPMEVNYSMISDPEIIRDGLLQLRPLVSTFATTDALPRLDRVSRLWEELYDHYYPPALPRRTLNRPVQQIASRCPTPADAQRYRGLAIYDPTTGQIREPPGLTPPPRATSLQPPYRVALHSASSGTLSSGPDTGGNSTQISQLSSRASSALGAPPSANAPANDGPHGDEFEVPHPESHSPFQPVTSGQSPVSNADYITAEVHSSAGQVEPSVVYHHHAGPENLSAPRNEVPERIVISSKPSHGQMSVSTPQREGHDGAAVSMEMTSSTPSTIANPSLHINTTSGLGSSLQGEPSLDMELDRSGSSALNEGMVTSPANVTSRVSLNTPVSRPARNPVSKASKKAPKKINPSASNESKKRSREKQRQNAKLAKQRCVDPLAQTTYTQPRSDDEDDGHAASAASQPLSTSLSIQGSPSIVRDISQDDDNSRPTQHRRCGSTASRQSSASPSSLRPDDLEHRRQWEQHVYQQHAEIMRERSSTPSSIETSASRMNFSRPPSSILQLALTTAPTSIPSSALPQNQSAASTPTLTTPATTTRPSPTLPKSTPASAESVPPATDNRQRRAKIAAEKEIFRQLNEQVDLPSARKAYNYMPHQDKRPQPTSTPEENFTARSCHVSIPKVIPTTPAEQRAFDRERTRLLQTIDISIVPRESSNDVLTPPDSEFSDTSSAETDGEKKGKENGTGEPARSLREKE